MNWETVAPPLVSVCIVCFSPGKIFEKTFHSVLHQTYQNIEVFIWDNAPDGTIKTLVEQIGDTRVTYISSDTNKGPYGWLNSLLERVTGKYIAIQDHDDLWHPDKIQAQVGFLEIHEEYIWVGTRTLMYYEEDQSYFLYRIKEIHDYTIHPSLLFRRGTERYPTEVSYIADALFQKDILCKWESLIYTLDTTLTLHLIRASTSNYSYRWFRLDRACFSRVFQVHGISWYSLFVIAFELQRKIFYPLFSQRFPHTITRIEQLPFRILGNTFFTSWARGESSQVQELLQLQKSTS